MQQIHALQPKPTPQRRVGFIACGFAYAVLIFICLSSLISEHELSMGRNPIANLIKTTQDFIRPSFVDIWLGDTHLEYKSDDGKVLRVENRQQVEQHYLAGLARATWTTLQIATLGSLLAVFFSLPLAIVATKKLRRTTHSQCSSSGTAGCLSINPHVSIWASHSWHHRTRPHSRNFSNCLSLYRHVRKIICRSH